TASPIRYERGVSVCSGTREAVSICGSSFGSVVVMASPVRYG
ncbi:MAG: hypothetical protein ACI8ZW_000281, partial [Yoonia sp.]